MPYEDERFVAPAPRPDDTRNRIVDAALQCFELYGVSKTTFEDIAGEAGCSRATLYRYFPGKRALVRGVVHAEVQQLGAVLERLADEAHDLEGFLVAVLHHAGLRYADHAALQHVLAVEPEVVLPHVVFDGAERLFAVTSALLVPHLARFLPEGEHLEAVRLGEWVARLAVTYLFSPSAEVSLTDEDSVRHLVQTYVLPGVRARVRAH